MHRTSSSSCAAGKMLDESESLADAGVIDGSILLLTSVAAAGSLAVRVDDRRPARARIATRSSPRRRGFAPKCSGASWGRSRCSTKSSCRLIAGGHALLVGVPGLAKTLMVRSLAEAVHLDFHRIQFTPDLVPSDITGTEILEEDHGDWRAQLPIRPRSDLRQHRAGRRDQSRAAAHPGGAARGDAGAQRHARAARRCASRAVLRARHAESDRAGRHVSAARSAARPLSVRHSRRLPEGRRGDRDSAQHHRRARRRHYAPCSARQS